MAAGEGAALVCLQELTLSPYFAVTPDALEQAAEMAEPIPDGPTSRFAARCATEHGIHVHASLYERAPDGGLGYNTAIVVGPSGDVVARTRKLHIPVTAGYYEDRYFRPSNDPEGYPVVELGEGRFGFPTCWDQWFPELARAYSLAGAEVIVYPTAIGSEPDHPDFDTQPLWERVITGNGIANGTFMVAVNRIGTSRRCASTARRSSRTPTDGSSCRHRGTSPRCWSPISTWTSAATGWRCSRSCRRGVPRRTPRCWNR